MNPIKPKPFNQLNVAVDDQSHVARMGHFAQSVGGFCNAVFVTARERQAHTCDVGGVQTRGKLIRE